jgi:ATP-binding cassette subfamily E protein 1
LPQVSVYLDYHLCDPHFCEEGNCAAARVCEPNILRQEGPDQLPEVYSDLCLGCKDCISECPLGALRFTQ